MGRDSRQPPTSFGQRALLEPTALAGSGVVFQPPTVSHVCQPEIASPSDTAARDVVPLAKVVSRADEPLRDRLGTGRPSLGSGGSELWR